MIKIFEYYRFLKYAFSKQSRYKIKATLKKNETYKIETPSTQPKFCFRNVIVIIQVVFRFTSLNNKLTAKPTVKSIFESKTPRKKQAHKKAKFITKVLLKIRIYSMLFDRRSSTKKELAELQY
jgi:hypothetical protein